MAASFAKAFNAEEAAHLCGMAHDIGKYSKGFQRRILEGGEKVDHSTAGAQELKKLNRLPEIYCVSGHHSGLLDGGGRADMPGQTASLFARLNKVVEDYSAYKEEITLNPSSQPRLSIYANRGFAISFYIRMLFSTLVDADYLDTEKFMLPEIERTGTYSSIDELCTVLEKYVQNRGWLKGTDGINKRRSEILQCCLEKGKTTKPDLFTLTVPTGGGKTIASMAFALEHAKKNNLKRVIYVIPYCAIIDQTVDKYVEIFGENNVLAHYSEAQYNHLEESIEKDNTKYLAAENWDMPIVVTTAVQFFESLFSNRTSKCRKLHNIAESVVVFDEAQTIPMNYLRPCVYAISELVTNYGTSCVLCTATQPSLEDLVKKYNTGLTSKEIMENPKQYFDEFQRVRYKDVGLIEIEELAAQIMAERQILCIVSTRREAKDLYELTKTENTFHLSTLMPPIQRRNTLEIIRKRLLSGDECRVISTSLIEAGVDIDFPMVFRERAGLDSVVQAGGRCNREGVRDKENSWVTVFELDMNWKKPSDQIRRESAEKWATRDRNDYSSPDIIKKYFDHLYAISDSGAVSTSYDSFDEKNIVNLLNNGIFNNGSFPFKTVAENFKLIEDQNQITVFLPIDKKAEHFATMLINGGEGINRSFYRKLGPYCVSIYEYQYRNLRESLIRINEDFYILADMSLYDEKTGLKYKMEEGDGFFFV